MFHERLKRLRKERNLTQQDMADFLGITRQGYAKYENGQAETDLETLKKLANFFNVTTDYLIGNVDNEPDIDSMTDKEIDEEIKEIMKDLNVWYKDEPEDKKEKLKMLRKIIKTFTED